MLICMPGVYEERVLHALDWVLSLCYQRSIHVILVLTNYWPDYGGMQQYARSALERLLVRLQTLVANWL
jgi:mannan endo-1,4-beta-mannosidase